MDDLVWYASYGSNLLKERFMCYIRGGRPEGTTKNYRGCSDTALPTNDKQINIPHELYFSKQSAIWENKGVAFIRSTRDDRKMTMGRMYLINIQQFVEIVRQENALEPNDDSINIDIRSTIANGGSIITGNWYSRIIYLGTENEYPILSFTGSWSDHERVPNAPGLRYLSVISKGIKQTYNKTDHEIIDYLLNSEGITGRITRETLADLVGSV
jgi:hypothetical protein